MLVVAPKLNNENVQLKVLDSQFSSNLTSTTFQFDHQKVCF